VKARRWSQLGAATLGLTTVIGSVVSALAAPEAERRTIPVATYNGGAVTVGEIEDTIADSSPLIQATALEPASLREFLDRNLRFELQLQEAERRGYREDERVRKAVKDNAVKLMLGRDIDVPIRADPPSPEALRAFFEQHIDVFSVPEKRRASALFVATEAEARSLQAAFLAASEVELKALVQSRGLDVPSKKSGGLLGSFDAKGRVEGVEAPLDAKLVSAAFALPSVGAVSDVVQLSDKSSYALLKLTEIRPGSTPKLEEVRVRVSRRYDDERYDRAVQAIATSQNEQLKPVVHEDVLKLLHTE
jgi:hypothetical protein